MLAKRHHTDFQIMLNKGNRDKQNAQDTSSVIETDLFQIFFLKTSDKLLHF